MKLPPMLLLQHQQGDCTPPHKRGDCGKGWQLLEEDLVGSGWPGCRKGHLNSGRRQAQTLVTKVLHPEGHPVPIRSPKLSRESPSQI